MSNGSGCGAVSTIAAIIAVTIIVGGLFFLAFCTTTVDSGEECVKLAFGETQGTLDPGFHTKLPYVSTSCYPTRYVKYETLITGEQSDANFHSPAIDAKTNDGQEVQISFEVIWHIEPGASASIYETIGTSDADINSKVVSVLSDAIVQEQIQTYSANTLYSGNLSVVRNDIFGILAEDLAPHHVVLVDFVLTKPIFDERYVDAIESQQIAEEEIKTAEFNAREAEHRANQTEILARGEAAGDIARAEAEARRIDLLGQALRNNPEVLGWQAVQLLEGGTWGIMPNGVVPFFDVNQGANLNGGATQREPETPDNGDIEIPMPVVPEVEAPPQQGQ